MGFLLLENGSRLRVEDGSNVLLEYALANLISVQRVDRNGLAPQYVAASGGGSDHFATTGGVFLHLKNSAGQARVVTVTTTAMVHGDLPLVDLQVQVPAGGQRLVGPLPGELFAKPEDGLVRVGYDNPAGLTLAALTVSLE
jgi:hypothetical protein